MYLREKYLKMSVLILGGLLDDERLLNREALQGFAIFPQPYTKRELLQEVKWVLSVGSEAALMPVQGKRSSG